MRGVYANFLLYGCCLCNYNKIYDTYLTNIIMVLHYRNFQPPVLIQECFQHSLSEGGSTVIQAENMVLVDFLNEYFLIG